MNRIVLSGNVCKDIELRNTTSGIEVVSNSVAVKRNYKNQKGEYDTDFINFVAYKNNAEYLNKYAKKGTKVLLEGRINTRNYENEEKKKVYVTEMIVERIELLSFDNPKKNEETKSEFEMPNVKTQYEENEISISNEDLPF